MLENQKLWLKVSPDIDKAGVQEIIDVAKPYCAAFELEDTKPFLIGITATNTTSNHKKQFIPKTPGKGGGSGNAVYEDARRVQKLFESHCPETGLQIIACGGISSQERVQERTAHPSVTGVQLYTPLIFNGTSYPRELRSYRSK